MGESPVVPDLPVEYLHCLLDDAARDLARFRDPDDPNRRSAGWAALRDLDVVTGALREIRTALQLRLRPLDENAQPRVIRWPDGWRGDATAGNSGPGGPP